MSWYQAHKKFTWIGVSAVIAVLLGGGIFYFVHAHEEDKAKAQKSKQKAGPVRVRIIHPKEGGVERLVRRPGTVQAFQYADMYAKVSGYLENQEVDIGSHVEKDQVLAEVYAPEKQEEVKKAQADVKKAKANLKAVKAELGKLEADKRAADSRYEQSKADVKKAQATVTFRREQYHRYQALAKEKAIKFELVDESREQLMAAEASETAAEKAVGTAASEVEAAKAAIVHGQANIEDAEAKVGVAESAKALREVYAKYTKLISPYTGVVTKRSFHNGDFIRDASSGSGGPEALPVLAVARIDKMRVIIYVPDLAVPYLKIGDSVKLEIDALPDHDFEGKIARLSYAESMESRTMRTEVDLENPKGLLKAGMYGRMTVRLGREEGVRVPSTSLSGQEENDERFVFVVRDGKAHKVKVRVGIDDGIEATVRDGLSSSDTVVAERPKGLKDGAEVKVIGEGLEKSSIHRKGQGQEDKRTGGKKSGSKGKKSSGQGKHENQDEEKQQPVKSNLSGARESERPSTQAQKERKEFESSGGKKDSKQKKKSRENDN